MFTAEQREKAIATRQANKAIRDQQRAEGTYVKKARKRATPAKTSRDIAIQDGAPLNIRRPDRELHPSPGSGIFDWSCAPLPEALARLADFKRDYDKAAQIVLRRTAANKKVWPCWTQSHKDIVPNSVLALCKKEIEDGRWASRDDGNFKMVDGIRVPDPVICCNHLCHEMYMKSKPMMALSRH
jgi:hypothetical protein